MQLVELALDLLLRLALPAALASALVAGLATQLVDRKWWHLGLASALAAGLVAGNWLRESLPLVPDESGWTWLLPCALAALCLSAVATTFLQPIPEPPGTVPILRRSNMGLSPSLRRFWDRLTAAKRAARVGLTVAGVALLTACLVPGELWSKPWVGVGFGLLVLANTLVLEHAAHERQDGVIPVVWATILSGGAAAVLIEAHSARFTDGATFLAAALIGVAPFAWRSRLDMSAGALAVASYLPGLLLAGCHTTYSDVPTASFALVAAAPLALAASCLPAVRRRPAWAQTVIQIGLLSLPIIIAVALAIHAEGFAIEL